MTKTANAARTRIVWKPEHHLKVGKLAAQYINGGMNDLTAYRMAMKEALPSSLHRDLTTIGVVSDATKMACREALATSRRIQPQEVAYGPHQPLQQESMASLHEMIASQQATIAALTSAMHSLQSTILHRFNALENVVIDIFADLEKANGRDVDTSAMKMERPSLKIAIIGLRGDQAEIFRRDFPNVQFTFVEDGDRISAPSQLSTTHQSVVIARWGGVIARNTFNGVPNSVFVPGGMSSLKDTVRAIIKAQPR